MICNELSYGFGIKISAQANTSLYYLINHIFLNSKEIHIYVFFSFTMGTIILSYLLIKQPEVPWHAIFFFVCCALGWSFQKNIDQGTILGESWNSNPTNIKTEFKKLLDDRAKRSYNGFGDIKVLADPQFFIYTLLLSIMTLLESSVTMKLSESILNIRAKKRLEILSVGIFNVLAGVLGILPFSIPVGKNLLALKSGATNRSYLLLTACFTFVFGWVAWKYMQFLPMICISIFNASLGVLLIDTEYFIKYWIYTPKYALVFTFIVFLCFFVDLVICMILSWLLFFMMYMQSGKDQELYKLGDIQSFIRAVKTFDLANGIKPYFRENLNQQRSDRLEEQEEFDGLIDDIYSNKRSPAQKLLVRLEVLDQKRKEVTILYNLQNRFSFMYRQTHLANLRHLNPNIVVFNFESVFGNDQEFLEEYGRLVKEASEMSVGANVTLDVWVTGVPAYWFVDGIENGWLRDWWTKGKVVFIST